MKGLLFLGILVLPCISVTLNAQQARVVFYNVENLFDTKDDSLTADEEFLPGGDKHWTNERMYRKVSRICKTLVALGEGEMPAIVGLCEIENRYVLERLIYDTPMIKFDYRIIHRDSPDARGVDVAILYRYDVFRPDTALWLNVPMPGHETTREILMARGRLWDSVSVHIYINHWPSRYGGAGGSVMKRLAAASTLAASVKQLLQADSYANIIIMGDFNDELGDESLLAINKILGNDSIRNGYSLVNLSVKSSLAVAEGTIKHEGSWNVFDQVLVSPAIITGSNGCKTRNDRAAIFRAGFLLEPDDSHSGFKPFRTYIGPAYHDGFSDHLPVSIIIEKVGQDP
jgi:hypothetical protein